VYSHGQSIPSAEAEVLMIGNPRERWQLLCEQAAKEPNSAKLLAMVREINDLIDGKYSRTRPGLAPVPGSTWSQRKISLTSPKICAVTRPSSGETQ
jgi:hypothetical protein